MPATGPASSKRRRSTAVWMSSSPGDTAKPSLESSAAIARSPASMARCCATVSTPMPRSIRAWAREPATSSAPRRRSTVTLEVYASTRSDVGALRRPAHTLGARAPPCARRSDVGTSRCAPLDLKWRHVLERSLHARLGAQRQAEQLDEPARRGMVEGVAHAVVGREVVAVQRSLRAPADDLRSPALEAHPDHPGHVHLGLLDEGVERGAQRREPEAVVHKSRPLVGDDALEARDVARDRQALERVVGRVQGDRRRRLVYLAGLDADQAVLDVVDATDPARTRGRVELSDQAIALEPAPVDGHRHAALEPDLHDHAGGVLARRPLVDVIGGFDPRVLEDAGLDAATPQVRVHRAWGKSGDRDLDAVCGGVLELLRTPQIPVPDRRDHAQLGRKRTDGDVETHLVVALAGAPVRHRGRALLAGHVDEQLG